MELFHFKIKKFEKENQSLCEQLEEMKEYYEKHKQEEITSIKTQITAIFREKLTAERKSYESRI